MGTGLDDKQRKWVADKLRPHYTKTMPSQYRVTGHSKERPDVWIRDPRDSVVLQVVSLVMCILSRGVCINQAGRVETLSLSSRDVSRLFCMLSNPSSLCREKTDA